MLNNVRDFGLVKQPTHSPWHEKKKRGMVSSSWTMPIEPELSGHRWPPLCYSHWNCPENLNLKIPKQVFLSQPNNHKTHINQTHSPSDGAGPRSYRKRGRPSVLQSLMALPTLKFASREMLEFASEQKKIKQTKPKQEIRLVRVGSAAFLRDTPLYTTETVDDQCHFKSLPSREILYRIAVKSAWSFEIKKCHWSKNLIQLVQWVDVCPQFPPSLPFKMSRPVRQGTRGKWPGNHKDFSHDVKLHLFAMRKRPVYFYTGS